ncbi:hypothetical protein N7533_011932 [Penicillium manginii]|uniref:uncharacterized protein n=1 Tax=Penicillium manginii TaxID=203109 RepID=UPI0025470B1D|nr:uncharacterized protein N7533_011932 [Penicillium manginii]KAJ5739148.1 hypothetical protein N7533_011932 [Penicillium manginii]
MSQEFRDEVEERAVKRKRDANKRRASLACETCRKQKEKCEGGPPCWRCERLGRPCHFQPQPPSKKAMSTLQTKACMPQELNDNGESLAQIAAKCTTKNGVEGSWDVNESFDVQFVSSDVAFYSGEFSHWNFAERLRRSMSDQRKSTEPTIKEYWRPTHLQSSIRVIAEALSELPPRPIAEFLVNVFFKYGEVNNFWMQRDWIEEKISICYDPDSEYMTNDISWVCSLFAVLAIGTQMAHMEEDKSAPSLNAVDETPTCSEDSVGLVLYRVACKLIPDVILAASQESAQAFLLLAAYGLPVSTGGLSYTYFGLALKMAIQNGMHRKCSDVECDSRTNEFRNRLFWSIYTLERRTSIMHGRPVSIARSDISADLPKAHPAFKSPNFSNMMAFISVAFWTSEVAETLTLLKKCPKRLMSDYSDRLMRLRSSIKQSWDSLSTNTECKDLNPRGQLFRQNCHLKMCYMLIFIYMGRPFIFESKERERHPEIGSSTTKSRWSGLVEDCVESALEILDALQLLSENIGLCRASYTEFSSCRAALLVILAESLNVGNSPKLQEGLDRGMVLIRKMIGGTASESEISYIEAIEVAIRNLSSKEHEINTMGVNTEQTASSAYARFKDWTQSMKKDRGPGSHVELSSFSPKFNISPGSDESVFYNEMHDITDFFNPDWSVGDVVLDPDVFGGTS